MSFDTSYYSKELEETIKQSKMLFVVSAGNKATIGTNIDNNKNYPACFDCDNIRTPVTEEMLDMMTDDIYDRAVADGRINVDISVELETREDSKEEDRQMINRPPRRRRRNRFFRDLIRILLLRELIGRRQGFPRF